MYTSPDEAKSDVILAGAAALFGGFVLVVVRQLPPYPRTGLVGALVEIFWIFALTGLVPLLLARYRQDNTAAFGLDGVRDGWQRGLVLATPVALLGAVRELVATGSLLPSLLGRIGGATGASPVLTSPSAPDPVQMMLLSLELAVLVLGALLLSTFLTVRGREGFRPVELSLTQAVRTFGMGAAGAGLLLGMLRSIGPDVRPGAVLLQVGALAALVLLTDRVVPVGPTFARGAVLAPVVVVAVIHVFAFGGLLRGNLLAGLHTGALGAGTATVVAVLIATRRWAWAVVPLMVALHWWPSCLSPIPFDLRAAGC